MGYEKVIVLIPEVKRATLGGKPKWKKGAVSFKTKNGKKMVIPSENVLFQDEKSIYYKMLRRKHVKGDFELNKEGFLEDSDLDAIVNPSILATAEEKAPRTKEQKEQDKKRAALLKKARESQDSGGKKSKKVKLKVKKKKKK